MSVGNNFWHWCRIPPEPPKNRHKKLLASSLLCTIIGFSIFASLAPFYGGLIAGQGSALAASSTILSVANLAEGPFYIQNVTYQPLAETNNSTVQNYELSMKGVQDNELDALRVGGGSCYGSDDLGNMNTTVVNFGEQNFTVTAIEIYQGTNLFALINGPFIVRAHSIGFINFQIYNLTGLSKVQAQQLTQSGSKQEGSNKMVYDWRLVQYTVVLKTSEGVTPTFDKFIFPTSLINFVDLTGY